MMEDIIPYGRHSVTGEDIEAVVQVLQSSFLTQGPKIAEFERNFNQYVGSEYSVAVSNATAGLHIACMALNLKPNQKVITTPITFCATANAIRYCGAEVEFVDIDPETFCIDVKKVEQILRANPKGTFKGMIPVDMGGYPVDMVKLRALADEFGLWIIEDACHAPGASLLNSSGKAHKCGDGSLADLTIFSFHPVKHIASGEGGMITTNNLALYERLRALRSHGIDQSDQAIKAQKGGWFYEMKYLGFNYRMTDIQAALGCSQLSRAEKGLAKRRAIAKTYDEAFKGTKVATPKVVPGIEHAYHLYIIQTDDRAGLYNHLKGRKIYSQIHYIPIPMMPYYKSLGYSEEKYPVAMSYYQRCQSIPMYPDLSHEQQAYVIKSINEFVG